MRAGMLTALLLLVPFALRAQSVERFNFGSPHRTAVFNVLGELEGKLLIRTENSAAGMRLRSTDGTNAGTEIISEDHFNTSSYGFQSVTPGISALGMSFYWYWVESAGGCEVWRTDGTKDGDIRLIHWPYTGPVISGPQFAELNGFVYFTGPYGSLHRTDGTPQGTVELSATGFGALSMVAFNGKLYMNLEGSNGWELHVSDGSGAAPTELLDVNPNGDAGPRLLEIYEGHLYFAADDGVNGAELWRTDGTQAGTALVVPLTPPGVHSIISDLVICNGLALFLLRSRDPPGYYETLGVWRTDGTPAGTFSVKDIAPGENFMTWLGPGVLMEDRVYFGVDGTSCEIWSTDGSMVGTRKEWTAPTGTTAGASMQVHDNALYFTLQRAGSWRPHEVWRLDGGEATMLFDFHLIGDATSVSFLGSTESCVFMLLLNTDDAPAWESTCWVLRTNADFSGSSGKDKDQNGCSTACANSRSVWVFLILGTILAALRRRLSHAPGATPVDEPAWRLGLTKSDGGNHRIACSPELMPRKW